MLPAPGTSGAFNELAFGPLVLRAGTCVCSSPGAV